MSEARQDIHSPEPVMEESEPIPVQEERGQRLWLWIGIVAAIFVIGAILVVSMD